MASAWDGPTGDFPTYDEWARVATFRPRSAKRTAARNGRALACPVCHADVRVIEELDAGGQVANEQWECKASARHFDVSPYDGRWIVGGKQNREAALLALGLPPSQERTAARNGRAKYGFYVVDKITGLVHAGNEFREDAVDERKAMIEEGVPASRVAVMTAASVRSKFGAIKWGTGRP